jgi:hypothetical protein
MPPLRVQRLTERIAKGKNNKGTQRKGRVETAAAIAGSPVDWLAAIKNRADKAINK